MQTSFEKLIDWMPTDYSVLDVGCGGLDGENTSDYLIKHFGESNITGICKDGEAVKRYKQAHPKLEIRHEEYHQSQFTQLYDLVVHDLNIENNLLLWEDLTEVKRLLKPSGFLITYIMVTTDYGEKDTPALIQSHWNKFWQGEVGNLDVMGRKLANLQGFECIDLAREERRPYIYWVLLKDNE